MTKSNFLEKDYTWNGFNWSECFIFICWYIWKWRNKGIFEPQFVYPGNPLQIIIHCIVEWFSLNKQQSKDGETQTILLSWVKPPLGHFKLNVDGSRDENGTIGAGGIIRNWSGSWIQGFSHNIGGGELIQAEVWGIFIGLKMTNDLQIKKLLIESDSAIAVNLLMSADIDLHPLATIIRNCHGLMKLFDSCQIQHVYRECNYVADALAKNSLDLPRGTTVYCCPPAHLSRMVVDDIVGVGCLRMVGLNRS